MLGSIGRYSLAVEQPWWLIAIPLILPPLVLLSMKSLAGLGRVRQTLAILFRSAVVILLILSLAELQTVRRNDRLTTLFVLDRSDSIPKDWKDAQLDFVNQAIKAQKRSDDMAGVVVFGKEPKVENPPSVQPPGMLAVENTIDGSHTDLAAALKLALASFPEDTARRIVVLSDGNENRGNALEQALVAKGLNVQIDVLPIEYRYDREVLVEKIAMPPDVKQGETVNINVVLRASEPTKGLLQIFQKTKNYRQSVTGDKPVPVELHRGINVFSLKQTIKEPDFYTFTAEFIPDKDSGDQRAVNNRADGFVNARGVAKVLLIEGTRGEHEELVKALQSREIAVDVLVAPKVDANGIVGGDQLPNDLAQLQPYDAIILGDVPKDSFTEQQIEMFEKNTHDFGSGLVMLGGPHAFGAGGWQNTPVEKALPVDMQIKAMKVMGKSALVMIMHASEIPEGNFWQKKVAQEALKTLSSYDYAGMLHWEGQEAWLFTLRPIGDSRGAMLRAIDRMTPGDMPDFDPSLQMALNGLKQKTDAMTKHIIVISDGDPTPPTPNIIRQLVAAKVTVTCVLVAAHGGDVIGRSAMQNLATKTKGRFYDVQNPKALPRIYQKEARLISRPLIFERPQPWMPVLENYSEPILGVPKELPGITGLVLTQVKENELVEVPIVSPLPTGQRNPVLAHWTYGLGRAVAFTSDAGRRWAKSWPDWDSYAAFWSQVIRWSLRPTDTRNLTMVLRHEEGRIKVVVDALDKDDQFLNFLQFRGSVVDPDLKTESVELVQTAPGHYEGVVENAEARGNYFVNLGALDNVGQLVGVLSAGVSVPYSDEYRELKSNPATLETLADLTGGKKFAWKTRRDGTGVDLARTLDEVDVFRRDPDLIPPRSFQDLWPSLLWLAAVLFLGDVAVRRVAPDSERLKKILRNHWEKLRGREVAPPVEYMEKLKGRKAEVEEQIERSRAATRFEAPPLPTPTTPIDEPLLTGQAPTAASPSSAERPGGPSMAPEKKEPEPESYTNRLLKAKKRVWEEREKDKDKGKP
ncbi:MAG: VWA domain-containing protein [Isosphaeraceae bacterium]|nr:VWA domain-containing protein [Isosphaeraceae bacterium]